MLSVTIPQIIASILLANISGVLLGAIYGFGSRLDRDIAERQ